MNWYKKIIKISWDNYNYSDDYWKPKENKRDSFTDENINEDKIINEDEFQTDDEKIQFAYEEYYDRHDNILWETVEDFNNSKPGERQPWTLIPLERVKKIWLDFVKMGFVRDVAGLERIAQIVIENIQKIHVNTILMEHTPIDPDTLLSEIGLRLEESDSWGFEKWCVDEKGSWRISDYALNALAQSAVKIDMLRTPEQKLMEIDKVFNIVHQRSDLASWFIEGGASSLSDLSNQESHNGLF